MATTINTISDFLDERNVKHKVEHEQEVVFANWQIKEAGENGLNIVFDLQENGEFLMISALRILECPTDHENLAAVLQAMAESTWKVKMMRWEYDPSDGEIRASIHLPIEDSEFTASQLHRALGCILQMCGRYLPVFRKAKDTGIVDLETEDQASEIQELMDQFREFLEARQTGSSPLAEEVSGIPATELDELMQDRYDGRGGDSDPMN